MIDKIYNPATITSPTRRTTSEEKFQERDQAKINHTTTTQTTRLKLIPNLPTNLCKIATILKMPLFNESFQLLAYLFFVATVLRKYFDQLQDMPVYLPLAIFFFLPLILEPVIQ